MHIIIYLYRAPRHRPAGCPRGRSRGRAQAPGLGGTNQDPGAAAQPPLDCRCSTGVDRRACQNGLSHSGRGLPRDPQARVLLRPASDLKQVPGGTRIRSDSDPRPPGDSAARQTAARPGCRGDEAASPHGLGRNASDVGAAVAAAAAAAAGRDQRRPRRRGRRAEPRPGPLAAWQCWEPPSLLSPGPGWARRSRSAGGPGPGQTSSYGPASPGAHITSGPAPCKCAARVGEN